MGVGVVSPGDPSDDEAMTQTRQSPIGNAGMGRAPWVTGLNSIGTFAWYALPDYVPSKKRRVVAKAALVTAAGLYGAYQGKDGAADSVEVPSSEMESVGQDEAGAGQSATALEAEGLAVVGILVGLTAGVVVLERVVQWGAEELSHRGVTHPHTKIGLALGALTPLIQRGIEILFERGPQQT